MTRTDFKLLTAPVTLPMPKTRGAGKILAAKPAKTTPTKRR